MLTRRMMSVWLVLIGFTAVIITAVVIYLSTKPR
jgi:hypothetical protein